VLERNDWVRLSIDAADQDTFIKSHMPRKKVTLLEILENAKKFKQMNPKVSLGYSFVIVWDGIEINGHKLHPNINEMVDAAKLAKKYSFDYISFKPFLLRLEGSKKESLLESTERKKEEKIIETIRANLKAAKEAGDSVNILESLNLQAMLQNKVHELKHQPKVCHAQFFRTVVTPSGIFHCPAFRGVEKARIGGHNGYTTEEKFNETNKNLIASIKRFNAEQECSVVGCFYHHMNWWIEDFIKSGKDIDEIEPLDDNNFFL
jgi:hypothetical protein